MSGKFIFFFAAWLLSVLAGFTYAQREFIAIPFFAAAFIFGLLLLKQLRLELALMRKEKDSGGESLVEASSTDSSRETPTKSPLLAATGGERGENSLRAKAESISTMCIGLGATPAVNSFIASRQYSAQDAAVFRYSLRILHFSMVETILRENDLDGHGALLSNEFLDAFKRTLAKIEDNTFRFSDFIRSDLEIAATLEKLLASGYSGLQAQTNLATLTDYVYPRRCARFREDLAQGTTEFEQRSYSPASLGPTIHAARRLLYLFSGDANEIYGEQPTKDAVTLNAFILIPNFTTLLNNVPRLAG